MRLRIMLLSGVFLLGLYLAGAAPLLHAQTARV